MKFFPYFSHKKKRKTPVSRNLFELPEIHKKRRKKNKITQIFAKIIAFGTLLHRRILLYFIVILWCSIWGILLFFFRVETIYITRQDSLIDINQAYKSTEYIRGKNIFFISQTEIQERIKRWQEVLQNIEMQRVFPSTLKISLKSYDVVFRENNNLILKNGYVFPFNTEQFWDTPFIERIKSQDIQRDTFEFIPTKDISAIEYFKSYLTENLLGFQISYMRYYQTERELHIFDSYMTMYILDLSWNLELQGEKLAIYWAEKNLSWNTKDLIYIDVRVSQRLFICRDENKIVCKNNLDMIYKSPEIKIPESLAESS